MNKRITDINHLFSTPVWTVIVPNYTEINNKISSYIAVLRSEDPLGKIKSNLSGWHSKNFNIQDKEPLFFINRSLYLLFFFILRID